MIPQYLSNMRSYTIAQGMTSTLINGFLDVKVYLSPPHFLFCLVMHVLVMGLWKSKGKRRQTSAPSPGVSSMLNVASTGHPVMNRITDFF